MSDSTEKPCTLSEIVYMLMSQPQIQYYRGVVDDHAQVANYISVLSLESAFTSNRMKVALQIVYFMFNKLRQT
jgi:hypothetical protein